MMQDVRLEKFIELFYDYMRAKLDCEVRGTCPALKEFGEILIKESNNKELALQMGRSTTKTTEKYYCQKTIESAISEAQKVWENAPNPEEIASSKKVKNLLINKKIELTGYA